MLGLQSIRGREATRAAQQGGRPLIYTDGIDLLIEQLGEPDIDVRCHAPQQAISFGTEQQMISSGKTEYPHR